MKVKLNFNPMLLRSSKLPKLVTAHCTVTSNILTNERKSQKMYISNLDSKLVMFLCLSSVLVELGLPALQLSTVIVGIVS